MGTVRIASLGAVAALATWLLAREATALLAHPPTRVDDVVALGAAAAGAGVALWYTGTALALLLAELAALGRATARLGDALHAAVGRVGAPVLRRAAVIGVGTGLALGALPAGASGTAPEPAETALPAGGATGADGAVPHDLRPGLSGIADLPAGVGAPAPQETTTVPDDPTPAPGPTEPSAPEDSPSPDGLSAPWDSSASGRPPAPAEPARSSSGTPAHGPGPARAVSDPAPAPAAGAPPWAAPPGGPAPTHPEEAAQGYVVRPGDSLWAITAAHLGPGATDAEIAAGWPRWHETNRAVIGADPHLIHPGLTLLAPDPKDPS